MVIDDIPLNSNEILFSDRRVVNPIPEYFQRLVISEKKHWGSHDETALAEWIHANIGGLWSVHSYDFLENTNEKKAHYTRKRRICVVISFENPDDKMMFELMGGMDAINRR